MKSMVRFISSTIIGGIVAIVPLAAVVIILLKVHGAMVKFTSPFTTWIPMSAEHPTLVGTIMLLLLCFLVGLLFDSKPGKWMIGGLENNVLIHVPGYTMLRNMTRRFVGVEEGDAWQPALAEIEEALVPAFIIERLPDGRSMVFVPAAPDIMSGALYILTPERVHPVDVPMGKMVRCIKQLGLGTPELLAAMKPSR